MELVILLWRSLNVVLALTGLFLLLDDIRRRHHLKLRQRFYWQAVALLLVSTCWGSIAAIVGGIPYSLPRMALATVALSYFIFSIEQVRRFNRREEREQRAQADPNGGLS